MRKSSRIGKNRDYQVCARDLYRLSAVEFTVMVMDVVCVVNR